MSVFLRELQDVYNEGSYPLPVDLSSMARGQKELKQGPHSYSKEGLPGSSPGKYPTPMVDVSLSQENEEESTISKSLLYKHIGDLLEVKGNQTALEALSDLLIFIKKN